MKMNLKTPGREDKPAGEIKLYTRADMNAKSGSSSDSAADSKDMVSALILKGLGNKDNISDLDCCATRLRITVNDSGKVSEDLLKQSGAVGVIAKGNGVQVIYGPQVTVIKSNLEDFIQSASADKLDELIPDGPPAEPAKDDNKTEKASGSPAKASVIYAPLEGKVIPLSEVPDDVFAEEILGKGVAIQPKEGKVYAPANGTISQVSETKHAVGITTDDGVEVLIHVGVDTIKLKGQHYDVKVAEDDKVSKGDLLLECDLEKISAAGYPLVTPVIIVNTDEYEEVTSAGATEVKPGDELIRVK